MGGMQDFDHKTLYELIKTSSTAEAKVNYLADLMYKLITNDIHDLKCEVKELQRFQWKFMGAVMLAWAVIQCVFKYLIK
jgi:hypothetical protein